MLTENVEIINIGCENYLKMRIEEVTERQKSHSFPIFQNYLREPLGGDGLGACPAQKNLKS